LHNHNKTDILIQLQNKFTTVEYENVGTAQLNLQCTWLHKSKVYEIKFLEHNE